MCCTGPTSAVARTVAKVAKGERPEQGGRGSIASRPMISQFCCDPSDPLPAKQGFCLSRWGGTGPDLHWAVPPEKRGLHLHLTCLPGRAAGCVTTQFVDFSQGAAVGTPC